ncbi:lipid II flippase family protein [Cytobacillus sp. IB215665]|uniref:lipid II flippase family protein n=1 Tax=Cytobacillus sp. IB215665 TaxID=3097357 RepID=UPI002A1521BC|nr:DUF2837 family protein [Cytobacillus sp. IB215665]MDX8365725.1 DUF2837 family protein [Cytobacillus sp. IB215665]
MFTIISIIIFFTIVIHSVETLSYSIRLGGVRLRKLAVSLSLTGVVLLVARTSNMFHVVLLGGIIDQAKVNTSIDIIPILRLVLLSATIGTFIAILLFPTMTRLSVKIIKRFEIEGSVIRLFSTTNIQKLKHTDKYVKYPRFQMLHRLRIGGIPKRILLTNMIVTAIYTSGVLASLYASLLNDETSTASLMTTGVINGFATILLTIFLDPQVALLTEKSMLHPKGADKMAETYGWLMISRLFGTILAQLFLIPSAYMIVWITKLTNLLIY